MAAVGEQIPTVLVWFEDNPAGRSALDAAYAIAQREGAHLAVITVATHERVIGCGRCLQGTVLWNLEMKKIARQELVAASRILDGATDVSYELLVGDPADVIAEAATRTGADTVVFPPDSRRRFAPPNRRNVSARVAQALGFTHSQTASPSPSIATAQRVA